MRRVLAISSLVLAWLCANGVVWNALQLLAWGKMFTAYSETMSLSQALRETLNPAKACDMCRGIAKAKNDAESNLPSPQLQDAAKFVLVVHNAEPVIFGSPRDDWDRAISLTGPRRARLVPLRPPRAGEMFV